MSTAQERRETAAHHIMAATGGFFGIYALLTRGGTFGSSETSNLIYLVISGLSGSAADFLIRLGATACYTAGIALAALGRHLRGGRCIRPLSLLIDCGACLLLARIPADVDPILSLYPMFFATAVQWVAFSQAAGYSPSTIFSTNNLRQCTEGLVEYLRCRDETQLRKFRIYGGTLLCFHAGVVFGWLCLGRWGIRGILGCLPILALALPLTLVSPRKTAAAG